MRDGRGVARNVQEFGLGGDRVGRGGVLEVDPLVRGGVVLGGDAVCVGGDVPVVLERARVRFDVRGVRLVGVRAAVVRQAARGARGTFLFVNELPLGGLRLGVVAALLRLGELRLAVRLLLLVRLVGLAALVFGDGRRLGLVVRVPRLGPVAGPHSRRRVRVVVVVVVLGDRARLGGVSRRRFRFLRSGRRGLGTSSPGPADPPQGSLPPAPVGPVVARAGGLLPQIVELDELGGLLVGQQVFADAEEVFAELADALDEALGVVVGPLLVEALGSGALDERLERAAGVVAGVVQNV